MQRRTAGEAVEPYRRRIHDAVTDPVRSTIESWAESVWPNGMVWPELPKEIQDRDADVWEPLIAIADAVQAYARGSAPGCWTQTPNARFKSEGQIAKAGAGDQRKNKID